MANIAEIIDDIDNTDFTSSLILESIDECKVHLGDLSKQYTVVIQNIRSINKNFDEFSVLLSRLLFPPDIIILTECWLDNSPLCYEIDNYIYHSSKTYLNQNDGIVVYTKSSLQVSIVEPLFKDSNCLLINVGNELSLIALYRSPSHHNIDNFCDSLSTILSSCRADTCAIVGDINIDITTGHTDRRAPDYLDITSHYGYFPGHTLPTRGDNCLDHVMLNTRKSATVIICKTGITDHETIVCGFHRQQSKTCTEQSRIRIDYPNLLKDIEMESWDWLYECTSVTNAYEQFVEVLSYKINLHTYRHTSRSSDHILKPWVTKGLLKCIRRRDLMHVNARKKENRNNLLVQQQYKQYRNYCNNILTNLKVAYDRKLLEESNGNSKKLWHVIKKICNIKCKKSDSKSELITNNKNSNEILNNVNNYFSTVGEKLAMQTLDKLGLTETELAINNEQYSTVHNSPDSFFFAPTDEEEVNKIITQLKTDSAPGYDGLNNKIIKLCSHALVAPITFLCNLSLFSGTVPECLKIANICPIHKAGDAKDPANYRPISLLTGLSKILEKVVNKRLLTYLENKNLLSDNQYGFRLGRSTEDAVTNLGDYITHNLDQGRACTGIFLDLAKAFDTISRKILIRKLSYLGIRGTALDWFSSYLNNRTQRVVLDGQCSDPATVNFGVPQGSVLGPTLFIIYINDLCSTTLPQAKIFTYADDTAIVFHGKTWEELQACVENGLQVVANWLQNNLLTLNIKKTKAINFAVSKRSAPRVNMNLRLHSCNSNNSCCTCPHLEQADCLKYLGIHLDNRLNWLTHLNYLSSRIRKLLFIFKRLGKIADVPTVKMVYFSLCQSVVQYCISSWGISGKTYLLKVEKAQRALLKVAYRRPFRYPTNQLYSDVSVLRVRQLYILSITLRFHKTSLNHCAQSHSHRKVRWDRMRCYKSIGRRSFCFMGPYIYEKINNLHNIIKLTKNECKKLVTNWLLMLNYSQTEEFLKILK